MEKPSNRLVSTNPIKRYVADPSALGLFAFAVITFLSGTIHCHWHTDVDSILFAPAVLYGGLTQIIAGIMDMLRGEKVGGSTFVAFGIYWMSQGIFRWPGLGIIDYYESPSAYHKEQGWYILAWAFVAFSSTLATLQTTVCQVALMVFVTIAFINLAFVNFFENAIHEKVTGYFLLITAALAWYNGTVFILRNVSDIKLPLGKLKGTNLEDPVFNEIPVGIPPKAAELQKQKTHEMV
eukprot:Blabericola_migrator_1__2588@NODE_1730_length_3907_cov_230_321615_g1117_i0_p2_GENE_NODE_1730_length_3907_cov_230_321615_g1117_i0NODE_1730_length_3907_cov_230_321615_g1117_i0_p2_ORF_typecomplete_len237_score41_69Gpr1_Fun34_YaaH/PF01184_19/4_4e44_NODE_1730_length_3907_cov_230_321615_g1117_i011491859